jgi:hypothetical protein
MFLEEVRERVAELRDCDKATLTAEATARSGTTRADGGRAEPWARVQGEGDLDLPAPEDLLD